MKRMMMGFVVLALLISNYAYATTYTYTGQNFTQIYSPYTTDMRVTGTIVTSSPIPPNSVDFDITPILASWSFNDGVNTISSSSGRFTYNNPPIFSTDAQGNIIDKEWQVGDGPLTPVENDPFNIILSTEFGDTAVIDALCLNPVGTRCGSYFIEPPYAQVRQVGTWVKSESAPSTVPTLPQWSLILLMLGMVGIARVRREV